MFGRMDGTNHPKVGWVYFMSAWMSLFLINGIIIFMLNPGGWLITRTFEAMTSPIGKQHL